MLNDPVPQLVLRMAFPTIISFMIISIYNLADTYFVSGLGTNATAAVSVNASLDQIIMMAGSMLAIGANSYIARLLGARNREKATKVLSTAFFTAAAFGLILLVFGLLFMGPLVRLLGATDSCESYSIEYARYVLLVAPVMATSFVLNQCLRAEGAAMLSMIGMGFGGILNCILDPIFITGLGLGVTGASMATAISKLVSFAILIFPYARGKSLLKISPRQVSYSRDIVYQIVSVGSSSLFRNGLAIIAAILLNNMAGEISDSLLAGIGVSTKIMMFPFGFILGFGSGFQPVTGYSWGAKNFDRVKETFTFSSKTALISSAVMALVVGFFADSIIRWFTATDPQMMYYGELCIRLQCVALPIHAWVAVVNMFCAGIGYAGGAVLLAISRQGICFLPILFPMAYLFGAEGLASVQAAADLLTILLAVPVLRHAMRLVREAREKQEEEVRLGEV